MTGFSIAVKNDVNDTDVNKLLEEIKSLITLLNKDTFYKRVHVKAECEYIEAAKNMHNLLGYEYIKQGLAGLITISCSEKMASELLVRLYGLLQEANYDNSKIYISYQPGDLQNDKWYKSNKQDYREKAIQIQKILNKNLSEENK